MNMQSAFQDVAICSFLMSDFEDLLLRNQVLHCPTQFVGLKMKRIKNSYMLMISKDAKTRFAVPKRLG
jgi:CRP/FNR family transcriptional regulator